MSTNQNTCWYLESSTPETAEEWIKEIQPTPFTIGRRGNNNLVLRSKWISNQHAEIHLSGKLLWIRDLASTNGTYVNHQRIAEAKELKAGDTVHFGRTELQVNKKIPPISSAPNKTYILDMSKELELTNLAFRLEPEFRALLQNRSVVPYYQSIVDLSNLQVVGYEVLGRITEGQGLPSNPTKLFEIAAFLNLAPELSTLFRAAGIDVWQDMTTSHLLFVNTHPSEISRMGELEKSLKNIRMLASDTPIAIEIHESAVPDIEELKRLRGVLNELDMQLAYDDFGVGQTRLVELAKIPPDYLKFDISIIRNIHLAPKSLHKMVVTFVTASHDLGIATLAEGVEQLEECDMCRQLGFKYAQGFLFSKPLPGNDIEK